MIIKRQKDFGIKDTVRTALTGVDNKTTFRTKADYDAHMAAEQAKAERAAEYKFPWEKGGSWEDRYEENRWVSPYEEQKMKEEKAENLKKAGLVGAGIAAAGAGGYAAYKAWKKKQAKKKEAQAQAEAKFDKKEEKK